MSICKDPNEALHCHVLGTRAAAFLFFDGFVVCLLCARGSRDIPSALRFQKGMEGPSTSWQRTPPSRNLEILVPMFFLQTTLHSQMSLIWLLAQPVGDSTFCAMRLSTQGVRGKKGGRSSKSRRPKVQVRHRTAYSDDTPAGWGTPPYNPQTG